MSIQIRISEGQVEARIMKAWEKGLYELSGEILADCNEYCKEDTGALIMSSNLQSQPQKGRLVWATPYAKRQYWSIMTSLTPGRTWKWCETAKRKQKARWQELAERILKENL
jgi:hypothetical protein